MSALIKGWSIDMSNLIDREVAIQGVRELFSLGDEFCDELSIVGMLNNLPYIEIEQKKGRWISDTYCSECGWVNDVEDGFIGSVKQFNFCPNCGVKMGN